MAFVLGTSLVPALTHGAITYSTAEAAYTQSFNTLSATGTSNTWTNDSTIPGFYVFNSGATTGTPGPTGGRVAGAIDNRAVTDWQAVTDYRSTGSSNSRLFAFGNTGSSNRALGSIAGSAAAPSDAGDFFYALVLQNTTGQTLKNFTFSYTGQQWIEAAGASGVAASAQSLKFSYLVKTDFDAAADIPTQAGLGSYTAVSDLDFTSPTIGNTGAVITLDGDQAANQARLTATVAADWAPDAYLILRFWDDDDNGNDHGLAIDDLSFSAAVPEPATTSIVIGASSLLLARRRRR